MSIGELVNNAVSVYPSEKEWAESHSYRCHVCVIKEDDGTYSAVVLNLPGCGSCGDTEEEALNNVKESILAVVESHCDADEDIPWSDACSDDIPEGAHHKWILVNG